MASRTAAPPMETFERSLFVRVTLHDSGLTIVPPLSNGVHLEWTEIEFVCVVPAMVRDVDGWREKSNDFLPTEFRSTLATHGFLEITFVLRDRRPLLARAGGLWNRFWVRTSLRPMVDAQDQFMPDQAHLRLAVYKHQLNHSIDELLDQLAKHCRFDLVVDF